MVKHIIVWEIKPEYSDAKKAEVKAQVKAGLEGLKGIIPGLLEITVYTEGLPSSNGDMMLDALFESPEALKGYATNPAHVAVADGIVRPNVAHRSCFDYIAD